MRKIALRETRIAARTKKQQRLQLLGLNIAKIDAVTTNISIEKSKIRAKKIRRLQDWTKDNSWLRWGDSIIILL